MFKKYFRIGLKVEKYVTGTNTINFGLQYTTLKNLNKYSEYKSVPTPQLLSNKVNLLAYGQVTNDSPSIQNQMYVNYDISSNVDINDQGSSTIWYINNHSINFISDITNDTSFTSTSFTIKNT